MGEGAKLLEALEERKESVCGGKDGNVCGISMLEMKCIRTDARVRCSDRVKYDIIKKISGNRRSFFFFFWKR